MDEERELTFEEKVKALADEKDFFNEPIEKVVERHIKDYLPSAVVSIARLAESAQNESVRLKAAMYMCDRGLGRIQDATPPGRPDPLGSFIEKIEAHAQGTDVQGGQ